MVKTKQEEREIQDMSDRILYELSNSPDSNRFSGKQLDDIGIEKKPKVFLEAVLNLWENDPNVMFNCGSYGGARENYFSCGASDDPPGISIPELTGMAFYAKKERKPADIVVEEIRSPLPDNGE